MYVLPAPVQAAALPAGLCPQGDSMSIGLLWNLFSYSRSSTRSEMECLDKVLSAVSAAPTVHVVQAPALPPAASAAPPTTTGTKAKQKRKTASSCERGTKTAAMHTTNFGQVSCQGV